MDCRVGGGEAYPRRVKIVPKHNPIGPATQENLETWPQIQQALEDAQDEEILLIGDFNCHHPLCDEPRNNHLFTRATLDRAQILLDATSEFGLTMALPKWFPTLRGHRTGNYTRPDNVFVSDGISRSIEQCRVRRPNAA